MPRAHRAALRLALPLALLLLTGIATACGAIPFSGRPAAAYPYGSGVPLRVAVIDDTGGNDWLPALETSVATYAAATPYLQFQGDAAGANIVITVHRYTDGAPPDLRGYLFPAGVGGFAAVYDAEGVACNFPPSTLPLTCTGEIASADVYLNDVIAPGPDLEVRRERLILHEMGHALGLTRHSPDLDIDQLALRYGWPQP